MKYALETLDILITETINPSKISIASVSGEEIDSYITTANEYKESSRLLLMDEAFTRVTETEQFTKKCSMAYYSKQGCFSRP